MRFALLVVALAGCGPAMLPGAPTPGASCDATRDVVPECVTVAEIASCEDGRWKGYSCPSDCRNAQPQRCDWHTAKAGDECPTGRVQAFCSSSTQYGTCSAGRITITECPKGCTNPNPGDLYAVCN